MLYNLMKSQIQRLISNYRHFFRRKLFQHFQIPWNLKDKNHENVISTNYLKEKWVKGSWTLPCLYDIALHGKRKISKIDQSNPIWWREGISEKNNEPIMRKVCYRRTSWLRWIYRIFPVNRGSKKRSYIWSKRRLKCYISIQINDQTKKTDL
mgnify:CR=1 FL=1